MWSLKMSIAVAKLSPALRNRKRKQRKLLKAKASGRCRQSHEQW
jgi:hypothetical protein